MLDVLRRILHMEAPSPVNERVDVQKYDAGLAELDQTIGILTQVRQSSDPVTGLVRGTYQPPTRGAPRRVRRRRASSE